MGFDIHVHLFGGFKIPLSSAFDSKLLSEKIMEEDDYQLIGDCDEKYRDECIDKHIISVELKDLLKNNLNWNIYILTSSQETFDYEKSYFILFDTHQDLINGRIPDYVTGRITDISSDCDTTFDIWNKIINIPIEGHEWEYKMHWVVESSY